jgi:hypothetical protein
VSNERRKLSRHSWSPRQPDSNQVLISSTNYFLCFLFSQTHHMTCYEHYEILHQTNYLALRSLL